MRILVVRVGNIGDVLLATPFLRKVKQVFEGCTLDFLTSPQGKCVVEHNAYLDNIYVYKKYRKIGRRIKRVLFAFRLSKNLYDLCFILELHPQYKKFVYDVVGPNVQKVGFLDRGGEFLDKKMSFSCDHHVIENYLFLLRDFFDAEISKEDFQMDFFLPEDLRHRVRNRKDRYFIIHAPVTEYLPYRAWDPEKFSKVIGFLRRNNFKSILTGKHTDRNLIDQILQYCNDENKNHTEMILDKSLFEIADLIKHASGVLCSDTGILHIARAFKVPVVGLFGPSNPGHTGCIGDGMYKDIRNDFECGPCNYYPDYRYNDKKGCLDGKIPACMNSLTVEQVESALKETVRKDLMKEELEK